MGRTCRRLEYGSFFCLLLACIKLAKAKKSFVKLNMLLLKMNLGFRTMQVWLILLSVWIVPFKTALLGAIANVRYENVKLAERWNFSSSVRSFNVCHVYEMYKSALASWTIV